MGQGARPVLADGAAGFAVAVPDRTHPHLARLIDEGLAEGGGAQIGDNAALVGVGTQAVGGGDTDVGRVPVVAVVEEGDVAEGDLPIGPVEEGRGGTLQILGQLGEVLGVVAGIPLQRDIQVEEEEGVIG